MALLTMILALWFIRDALCVAGPKAGAGADSKSDGSTANGQQTSGQQTSIVGTFSGFVTGRIITEPAPPSADKTTITMDGLNVVGTISGGTVIEYHVRSAINPNKFGDVIVELLVVTDSVIMGTIYGTSNGDLTLTGKFSGRITIYNKNSGPITIARVGTIEGASVFGSITEGSVTGKDTVGEVIGTITTTSPQIPPNNIIGPVEFDGKITRPDECSTVGDQNYSLLCRVGFGPAVVVIIYQTPPVLKATIDNNGVVRVTQYDTPIRLGFTANYWTHWLNSYLPYNDTKYDSGVTLTPILASSGNFGGAGVGLVVGERKTNYGIESPTRFSFALGYIYENSVSRLASGYRDGKGVPTGAKSALIITKPESNPYIMAGFSF